MHIKLKVNLWNLRSVFLLMTFRSPPSVISVQVTIKFLKRIMPTNAGKKNNAVTAVENRIYDAILTAMNNLVMPRIEMAVRSITELSGRGRNSVVQKPWSEGFFREYGKDFSHIGWVGLNIDQNRNDETRSVENFEDGNFPALRLNYDRQAHSHHNWFFGV